MKKRTFRDRDPGYLRELLLYKLTLEAERRVDASQLSKREMIRERILFVTGSAGE